jgi:hypothetical protein
MYAWRKTIKRMNKILLFLINTLKQVRIASFVIVCQK